MSGHARIVLPVLVLASILALVSCGGSPDEDTAEQREARRVAVSWLKAMADSNIKTACRLMDAENHRPHPEYPDWSPAKNCQEMWLHSDNTPLNWKPKDSVISSWGDSDPQVLSVAIEGDRATVYVKGIGQQRPVWLQRERGRWLIDRAEYPI
jgi:hypothetical protein